MPSSLDPAELDGILPTNPLRESMVEGLDAALTLESTDGAIRADFHEPDRIRIQVDPANAQRFLIVNELYHPNWRAYGHGPGGRTELRIWPTNVIMRGLFVPPGITEIEMRFEPFLLRWTAILWVIGGLVLGGVSWWALHRLDGAGPITSLPWLHARQRTRRNVSALHPLNKL
jgi:hypothetical protein